MAFDTFRTTHDSRPAEVIINGADIEVQVGGHTGTIWKFDKSLTPKEFRITSGNYPVEFLKDEASGLLTRCRSEIHGWQVVTPQTDKELATFGSALAVIDAVASMPGFPAAVREKLPEAHKALGFQYDATRHRG